MTDRHPTLLVTGASGHLGRRVVELLREAGATVIAATRNPDKLADLAKAGIEVRRADFDDPGSLPGAFAGVDRVLIVSTDAIGAPGVRQRQHRAAIDAAAAAGVKHVVYTSMPNPEPGSLVPFAPDHYETERALEQSGPTWTILRNAWYAENLLGSLPNVLATGTWFTSAGKGGLAHVAREDTARAAAAALLTAPRNVRYDITGPEALTMDETAAIAADVFGKPIQVVQVTDQQLEDGLVAAGIPPVIASLLVSFDANTRIGKFDTVSDAVNVLTGREPQSLRAFLAANRAAFLPPG